MQKTNKMEFLYPLRMSFRNLNSQVTEWIKLKEFIGSIPILTTNFKNK